MDASQLLLVVVLWTHFYLVHPRTHTVWKCCAKGMQFAEDAQSCVNIPGVKPSQETEILNPPLNKTDFYWLPTPLLSENVVAHYSSLSGIIMNVTGILYYEETNEYQFFGSHVKINSLMILDKRYCFETIQNSNNTRVQIMSIELAPLHKCCSRNQRLNSSGKCENGDYTSENTTEEEIVNENNSNEGSLQWLPNDISKYTLRVKYNFLKKKLVTDIVTAEGPNFRWDVLASDSDGIMILFRGQNGSDTLTSGMSEAFCFDEIVGKSSTHKVLVSSELQTKPIKLSKCCAKDAMFDIPSSSCADTQETSAPLSENVVLDSNVDNGTFSWIPYPFKYYPLTVLYDTLSQYNSGFTLTKVYSRYTDILAPNNDVKPVAPAMIQEQLLCVDTYGGSRIANEVYKIKPIFKCCAKGERLNSAANGCESVPGQSPELEVAESLEIYPADAKSLTWLPPKIAKFALNIAYSVLSHGIPFNYIVPENRYTSLTFTSKYSTFNELSLEALSVSGEVISLKTRVFCFDEVAEGALSPRVTLAFQPQRNIISNIQKCCEKGQILDIETISCVKEKNIEAIKTETLTDKMDDEIYQWIPQSQQYPLTIQYNTLKDVDPDLRTVVVGEKENTSDKRINSMMVWRESSCYDWSSSPPSRVSVIGYRLKPISKCCPKNHIVIGSLCVRISGLPYENVSEEIVYPGNSANVSWLPSEISYPVKVRYSYFRKDLVHTIEFYDGGFGTNWKFTRSLGSNMAIYVHVETNLPSDIVTTTDEFCFEQVKSGNDLRRVLLVRFPKEIWKCCPNKMELSNDTKSCVAKAETDHEDNAYNLYLPNHSSLKSWIPNEFKHFPVSIKYDMFGQVKNDFSATVLHMKTYNPLLEGSIINPATIKMETICYDNIQLSKDVQAVVHMYISKLLYKCCPKGERLTISGKDCEPVPGRASEVTSQEIINSDNFRTHSWIPTNLSDFGVKAGYNFFKFGFVPNMAGREDKMKWELIPGWKTHNIISFQGESVSGQHVEGISDHFCFDEVAEGPLAPRALLATTYFLYKCCKRGEYLVNGDITCAAYPGRSVDEAINGVVDCTSDPLDTYWLPDSLKRVSTPVLYNYLAKVFYSQVSGMIYDESVWKLDYGPDRFPRIVVNSTDLSGMPFVMEIDSFCFDVLDDSGVVLNYLSPISNDQFVRKCCYPGEILSTRGKCQKHNGADWSPGISNFRDKFHPSNCKDNIQIPVKRFCVYSSFQIHSTASERSLRYFKGHSFDNAEYSTSMYCNDYQARDDGTLREVVASCTFPAYAWEYESVRPLGAVAAALLMVALVLAVVQRETRRTPHGRALACHAFCLAAANVTQVAAHFANPDTESCKAYAYTAYFFMIAANTWLTSITFNMFLNFRQPLGALAKGARSEAAAALAAWRRFGALSAFAWFTAGGLTAFAVTVYHTSRTSYLSVNFVAPSFFETRTCLFEDYIGKIHKNFEDPQEVTIFNTWGAVCYYYAPAALLVITNAIFVVLTMIRIRDLRKGTSVLRRDMPESSSCLPSQHMQMALFYAKLLLATGVLELSVEAALWTTGRQWHPSASAGKGAYFLPRVNQFLLSIFATVVDFLRAISVFWLATREWSLPRQVWAWVKGRCTELWGWVRRRFLSCCEIGGLVGKLRKEKQDFPEDDVALDVMNREEEKMATSMACYNNAYDSTSDGNNDLHKHLENSAHKLSVSEDNQNISKDDQANSPHSSSNNKDSQDLPKECIAQDVPKPEGVKLATSGSCYGNNAVENTPDSNSNLQTVEVISLLSVKEEIPDLPKKDRELGVANCEGKELFTVMPHIDSNAYESTPDSNNDLPKDHVHSSNMPSENESCKDFTKNKSLVVTNCEGENLMTSLSAKDKSSNETAPDNSNDLQTVQVNSDLTGKEDNQDLPKGDIALVEGNCEGEPKTSMACYDNHAYETTPNNDLKIVEINSTQTEKEDSVDIPNKVSHTCDQSIS